MPRQERLFARPSSTDPMQEMAARELARRHLIDFSTYTYDKYEPEAFHTRIADELMGVISGDIRRLIVVAPPQHGKACYNRSMIITPNGWVKIEDLRPGDFVYSPDGKPVCVIAISEDIDCDCQVEFTDGSFVICHENHEWVVYDRNIHSRRIILETKKMTQLGTWLGPKGRGGRARFQLDANTRIVFPQKELPIPPYTLGVWLGNGQSATPEITYAANDIEPIEKIQTLGYVINSIYTHRITGVKRVSFAGNANTFSKFLKALDLKGNKHIPEIYLRSSIEQRLELLAGLIDTDGYVYQRNGRVTFSNANKQLIDHVADLVHTLGWRVTVTSFAPSLSSSGIQGKQTIYQLCFNPTGYIPTVLPRKIIKDFSPVERKRGIVSIARIPPQPGRCIQVEGGVYLVGETLIPTHNSELISVRLPAFWLAKRPDDPIILCSYGAALAQSKAAGVKEIQTSLAYQNLFPDLFKQTRTGRTVLAPKRGKIFCAGVGGPITGFGAALGIIDDPVKNFEEAYSAGMRDKAWSWWQSVFRTRIWEYGRIVVVATRWHEDDLIGRILNTSGENWKILRFPAIAEPQDERDDYNLKYYRGRQGEPDPLGRLAGEALAPSRYPIESLLMLKHDVGQMAWYSEFQGTPRPAAGQRIQRAWVKIADDTPRKVKWRIRYWDKAGTERGGAFTTGVLMSVVDPNIFYVENVIRGQWSALEREQVIKQTAIMDRDVYGLVEIWVEQEPGSGGLESAENTIRKLAGFVIHAEAVHKEKDVRFEPFAVQCEAGNVFIKKGRWNWDYVEEITSVPSSTFRDQADASSGAFNKLAEKIIKQGNGKGSTYRGTLKPIPKSKSRIL